jgi:succinate dehydrogenase / fumarate reductase iron-sulfur subunit
MKLTLKIWRQKNPNEKGAFVSYAVDDVDPEMSILECLDVLNETLILRGEQPVAFEHDCREGICGSCGFMINGIAHGPERATTACQLSMRHFKEGDTLTLEPWRAKAFPLIKDLVVNRRAFDHIIEAGGYISVSTALGMVAQMNAEGFGNCTSIGECTGVCPKEIPLEVIARMNRDYVTGSFGRREDLPLPVVPVATTL